MQSRMSPLAVFINAKCLNSFSQFRIVLLYVRTHTDEAFDALMLRTPTLSGLREAVSHKPSKVSEIILQHGQIC